MKTGSKFYIFVGIILVAWFAGAFWFFPATNQGNEINVSDNVKLNQDSQGSGNNILAVYNSLSTQAKAFYFKQSDQLTKPVDKRLVELDELTIGCFGKSNIMQMSLSDKNLGGQCCGVLKDIDAYKIQLQSLKDFLEKNGNIDLIPKDPYDLPVEHAQKLIQFDSEIVLTSQQQQAYDEAVKMSHHGGPCCCKCWKWYAMSGLAKKLIVDYGWDKHQIAELWDISSSCGHQEDTDMYKHYKDNPKEHGH